MDRASFVDSPLDDAAGWYPAHGKVTTKLLLWTCIVLGAANLVLFGGAVFALMRVLRASARDAHNSPRRRLLELDDGVARRGYGWFGSFCAGYRPWTTQKALLSMVAFAAALRLGWAIVAYRLWDVRLGVVRRTFGESSRVVFYGLDFFEAAAIFALFAIVARFWAELACAARQGSIISRSLEDDIRLRGAPPVVWRLTKPAQRISCLVAYGAATVATFLQATVWHVHETYIGGADGLVEALGFMLIAFVMAMFAHYAIVELRLVPIDLPTRRRRVFNISAVTVTCSTCLVVRAGVLLWATTRAIPVTSYVEMICILGYFLLLETMPLTVILLYNRAVPSPSRSGGRSPSERAHGSPEEEPLIPGTNVRSPVTPDPFNQTEIPRAMVHR